MSIELNGFGFKKERGHCWVSPGDAPVIGSLKNPSPDPRLKPFDFDQDMRIPFVMPMGIMVSINEGKFMVPANGGADVVLTYDAMDVAYKVRNSAGEIVAVGDTYTIKANKPIGWLIWDIPQNSICIDRNRNWAPELLQNAPTLRMEGILVLPVVYKTDDSKYDFKAGDLLVADGAPDKVESPTAALGRPVKFDKLVHDVDQVGGKIAKVEFDYEYWKAGLQFIKADEQDIQSESTEGFPRNIYNGFRGVDTAVYKRKIVWIKITL